MNLHYFTELPNSGLCDDEINILEIFEEFLDLLSSQVGVSNVVEVLAVIALAVVGLAFMWWGVRKVTRALMSAFKKGKISL